ncbi:MAG: bifunctional nuclease family protein [Anaerolineales bacterium]|nr:bifunctional nuclease family protein [Anaerolineales bacterium]
MSDMVEVVIDSIRVSLMSQQRVIILREMGSERYLPIMVGIYEAEHLTLAMQNVEVSRPLTYDLFVNMLETLGAEVIHVEVVALRNETYYGNIVVNINGTMHNIDSRPSDAMNLAVRLDVPIFASREVLDEAGLVPEEDLSEEGLEGETEVESERLSVFEDYLDQIKGEGGEEILEEEDEDDDASEEEQDEGEAPDEEDEGEEE